MGFGVCHESFKEHLDAGFYGFMPVAYGCLDFPLMTKYLS